MVSKNSFGLFFCCLGCMEIWNKKHLVAGRWWLFLSFHISFQDKGWASALFVRQFDLDKEKGEPRQKQTSKYCQDVKDKYKDKDKDKHKAKEKGERRQKQRRQTSLTVLLNIAICQRQRQRQRQIQIQIQRQRQWFLAKEKGERRQKQTSVTVVLNIAKMSIPYKDKDKWKESYIQDPLSIIWIISRAVVHLTRYIFWPICTSMWSWQLLRQSQ